METRRYTAYNSTRGTVLNSKLAIANRELEPLKFLELLIGGLGLDSESGLWLKPLAGAPQVPRVFPFDLVYLDRNERVLQSAEIFPSSDFPPYSDEAASAMVLPLHAASLSQTIPGDLLLMQDAEGTGEFRGQPAEAAEQVLEVKASAPGVAAEVAAVPPLEAVGSSGTAEAVPPAPDENVQATPSAGTEDQTAVEAERPTPTLAATEDNPPVDSTAPEPALAGAEDKTAVDTELPAPVLAIAEDKPAVVSEPPEPILAIAEYKPEVDGELPAAVPAAGAPNWDVPLEGFWAPIVQAEEAPVKKSKSAPKREGDVKVEAGKPQPQIAASSAPDAPENAGPVEKEKEKGKTSGTTASTSRPVIQSVGFTFSQYRNWQVSTARPPAAPLESQKSTDQGPTASDAVDSKQGVGESGANPKHPAKTSGNSQGGQSTPDSHVKWSVLTSRPTGKPGKQGSNARRAAATRKDLPLNTEGATSTSVEPKVVPGAGEAKEPIQAENSPAANAAPAVQDPAAKVREPSLPLWKISPNPGAAITAKASTNARDLSEGTKQPEGDVTQTSQSDPENRIKRSNLPVERATKKPAQPKIVVEPAAASPSHASRMPEAISRLMTALHRIGGGADHQPRAKRELATADQQASWLIPEALHRDRRRAVRRTVPGLVAYYFTGGAPQPYTIADISATGFFLVTRDQWMPETMILMTLQKPSAEGKQRRESITVLCKVVRRGEEGIGAEFVMPETLDPNSRDIKPSRATDRMALAQFLFSGEADDSLEVLGFVVLPPPEHQMGEQIESQEDCSPD